MKKRRASTKTNRMKRTKSLPSTAKNTFCRRIRPRICSRPRSPSLSRLPGVATTTRWTCPTSSTSFDWPQVSAGPRCRPPLSCSKRSTCTTCSAPTSPPRPRLPRRRPRRCPLYPPLPTTRSNQLVATLRPSRFYRDSNAFLVVVSFLLLCL